jgi:L-2-hydroxyglutarate oxidase LhgO
MKYYDNIIVGGGIIGLSLAKEIIKKECKASVLLIEKESRLGLHASGRNSGVLHSGIYYPDESEKAKHCHNGATDMYNFCLDNGIPSKKTGKIILPTHEKEDKSFNLLLSRASSRGNNVELLDRQQLSELEPFANSIMGKAIYLPNTVVVNPSLVINKLYEILCNKNVKFEFGSEVDFTDPEKSVIALKGVKIKYGKLYNCSGQNIDKVARQFNTSKQYTMIPIRGMYYKLRDNSNITIKRLIYPVPDLSMPFLGIHTLNTVQGETYFGPSAMPVFGREQYKRLDSIESNEAINIVRNLSMLYMKDIDGFRRYANNEIKNFSKKGFVKSVRRLIPSLANHDITKSEKVGIRAQLINKKTLKFEMDFLVERQDNVVHVLNAVSPAFTCSFSIAKSILEYSDK